MVNRVLVPLDGTPWAAAVLPAARTLASATGAALVLVRVTDAAHEGEALDSIRALASELVGSHLIVETLVRTGEPAEAIVVAARDSSADLVIMATHGQAGLQRAFAGSVTERVLSASPVPVVVVKPGGKHFADVTKLLVAVDGTVGGALALGAAAAIARKTRAKIEIVQVVPPLPTWMYGGADGYAPAAFVDPAWEEASLASAATYVNSLAGRLSAAGIQAQGRAVKGAVAAGIEQAADELDVDLIVMSTHALRGPSRAVLGSVADEVVRTSQRPVLLVHRAGGVFDRAAPAEAALTI